MDKNYGKLVNSELFICNNLNNKSLNNSINNLLV